MVVRRSLLLALLCLPNVPGQSQSDLPRVVEAVRIEGNRRIPETTIRYHIRIRSGERFDEQQVRADYRRLLDRNFFEDIQVKARAGRRGVIVVFEVRERPLVRGLRFAGMGSLPESDVLEAFRDERVSLAPGTPFDPAVLVQAGRVVRGLLEARGRPLGRVSTEVATLTTGSVELLFRVEAGPKVRIGSIQFEGNTVFSGRELRRALKLTRERNLLAILRGQDKYIRDRLEYDLQANLLELYTSHGYLAARAGDARVRIVEGPRGWLIGFRKTRQQYHLTIPVDEGRQYRFGFIRIEGVEKVPAELVSDGIRLGEGEVANLTAVREGKLAVERLYSARGYLDVMVVPVLQRDEQAGTLDVTIQVTEGRRYAVGRINFLGNRTTGDKVLRREFLLEPFDVFNGDLLELSIRRLNQLGYFEPITDRDYDVVKDPKREEVDIDVRVTETDQQSVGLSGGIGGVGGSFIGISYRNNNFRGLGQKVDLDLLAGTRTSSYRFAFTDPYLLDTRITAALSVFHLRSRFDTFADLFGSGAQSLFTRQSTGLALGGNYPVARFTRAGLDYSFQSIAVSDVAAGFESFAVNQLRGLTPGGGARDALEGILRSQISPSVVYNSKNSLFQATDGSLLSLELAVAGGLLGGDVNLVRPALEYQTFLPDGLLSGGHSTWAFRARVEHVRPFGALTSGQPVSVPVFERIFSGGQDSFRGFDVRRVSPWAVARTLDLDPLGNPVIDPLTGLPSIVEQLVPVGGDTGLLLTAEYRVPVAGPLRLAGFADLGLTTVLDRDNLRLLGPDASIHLVDATNSAWRASVGLEVQVQLPVVNQPFRLIFAYNPLRLDTTVDLRNARIPLQEPRGNVTFTLGYSF